MFEFQMTGNRVQNAAFKGKEEIEQEVRLLLEH
jgi:hypothetical protein